MIDPGAVNTRTNFASGSAGGVQVEFTGVAPPFPRFSRAASGVGGATRNVVGAFAVVQGGTFYTNPTDADFMVVLATSPFLLVQYGGTGANGTYTNFGAAGGTTVIANAATGNATLSSPTTYFGMKATTLVTLGANNLTLGDGTHPAGLILNTGAIIGAAGDTGAVQFANGSEADIYTSTTATINQNLVSLGGTQPLVFFGPGTLTLKGTASGFTTAKPPTSTRALSPSATSMRPSRPAIIFNGGTLQSNGGAALATGASQTITVNPGGGTLDANGGTITIPFTIASGGTAPTGGGLIPGQLTITSSAPGGIVKLTNTSANTFGGMWQVNSNATLQISNDNQLGRSPRPRRSARATSSSTAARWSWSAGSARPVSAPTAASCFSAPAAPSRSIAV